MHTLTYMYIGKRNLDKKAMRDSDFLARAGESISQTEKPAAMKQKGCTGG